MDIRQRVGRAADRLRGSLPNGIHIANREGWLNTNVTLVKEGVSLSIGNWVVNKTSGEWKAKVTHYTRAIEGPAGETTLRGQCPEEVIRSAATALAMGVFDG